MKSKEEIEKLAKDYAETFRLKTQKIGWYFEKIEDYTKGYTQCQEDIADKKYTEEDMISFAYQFSNINVSDFRKHLKDFDVNLKEKNKQ